MRRFTRLNLLPLTFLALVGAGCATLETVGDRATAVFRPQPPEMQEVREARQRTARDPLGSFHVVVDLDDNELRFMDGKQVLWSGPVGTGTGLSLKADENEWEFSTPNGLFYVQYKEENPVWILPDWYFVKNDRRIPPENSPERRVPGALGAAAVYLSDEIAIHGTDKPELLGQRVSHGCIRLSDENAIRLFHNVQIGTPVLITGGERLAKLRPEDVPQPTNPGTRPKQPNPLERLSTQQLLQRLDRQLPAGDTSAAWVLTTSELIKRGIRDDSLALRGVLGRAGASGIDRVDREFTTFLADAFSRGALRAVVSLARISQDARELASIGIVEGLMDLYPGPLEDAKAPWPSRRVPSWTLGPDGTRGWTALKQAEEMYRDRPPGTLLVMGGGGR